MRFLLKISIITILLAPTFILAQINYVPLAPIPDYVDPGSVNLTGYLQSMYKFGVALAGILAVLMLVWGGFKYTTSEAIAGKEGGKEIIQNVVWGGAIVLGSFLLLYTINPKLIDVGLAIQNLKPVEKQRIPTPQEAYGAKLDALLKELNELNKNPEVIAAKQVKELFLINAETLRELEDRIRGKDPNNPEIAALIRQREAILAQQNELKTKTAAATVAAETINIKTGKEKALYAIKNEPPAQLTIIKNQMGVSAQEQIKALTNIGKTTEAEQIKELLDTTLQKIENYDKCHKDAVVNAARLGEAADLGAALRDCEQRFGK